MAAFELRKLLKNSPSLVENFINFGHFNKNIWKKSLKCDAFMKIRIRKKNEFFFCSGARMS